MNKTFLLALLFSISLSGIAVAQKKKSKVAPPPLVEKTIYTTTEEQEGRKIAPTLTETPAKENPVRKIKYPSKPFVYFPLADGLVSEDFYLKREAQMQNFSTGDFPNKKKPVIKSVKEIYFELENNKKDTVRQYGDGWNEQHLYDENGNMTRLYVIFLDAKNQKDSSYLTTKYIYLEDKLAKKQHFDYLSGRKIAEEEFEYDESGRILKEYYFALNADGTQINDPGRGTWSVYKYPKKEEEIEERYEIHEASGGLYVLNKTVYRTFDKSGKKITEKHVDWPEENTSLEIKFAYDKSGRQIDYQVASVFGIATAYNKNGDIEKEVRSEKTTTETTIYSYKYDKNGNWIECISEKISSNKAQGSVKPKPLFCKRIIEYY